VAITSVNLQEGLGDEVEIMIGFSGLQYWLAISVVGVVMAARVDMGIESWFACVPQSGRGCKGRERTGAQ
jgi:hypothetical protein